MGTQREQIDALKVASEPLARSSCVSGPRFKSGHVVDRLCAEYPEMRKTGFRKAVRALVPGDADVAEALKGFLPDAFSILTEQQEVHAIEVIDTSPMDFNKGQLYYHLGEILYGEGWTLSVASFDYTGGLICHLPFVCFGLHYTSQFAGQELRDVLPAAMAVAKARAGFGGHYGPMRHQLSIPPELIVT